MISRTLSTPAIRAVIGLAISAAFVTATFAAVDLDLLAEAWGAVGLGLLALAAAISFIEVNVRASRWRLLLRRIAPVGHGVALGYLSIGHLANAILPARLGDVARALFTAVKLRVSRATILGTIAVERISDAALHGLAAAAGVLIGFRQLAPAVAFLLVAGLVATGAAAMGFLFLRREAVAATRLGGFLHHHGARFWTGATGLRGWREIAAWVALTVASFALTVTIFATVAAAVGISIPPWQVALVVAAMTLSTAIPAGPASIGTYEFVGMTVMVSMGFPPEHSLLTVGLVHVLVVIPPSLMGLAAMWWLGVRVHSPRMTSGRAAGAEHAR